MEEDDPFCLKEFREIMLKLNPDLNLEELKVHEERLLQHIISETRDIGQQHVMGGPLLDILSVSMRLKISPPPQGNWRIAGDIHVTQPADAERGITDDVDRPIFQRDSHNAQFVRPDAPFLTLERASPMLFFFPIVHLYLNLMAKRPRCSQLNPLCKHALKLNYTDYQDDMFDKVLHADFETSNADVCVKYITYRSACLAQIHFSLDVPKGQEPRQLKVSGRIHASWHHSKGDFKPHPEHERDCSCVSLYDSSFMLVTTGHPFQLIRSSVAVPSYATLILHVALNIEGDDCHHVLDFPVRDTDFSEIEFEHRDGFIARCKVQWETEYIFKCEEEEEEEEEAITPTNPKKKAKLTLPQVSKPICFYDTMLGMELVGSQMIEIFSVYVGANDKSTVCRVNGTIDIQDRLHTYRILETSTRKFTHGMKLPVIGPESTLKGTCFLQVHLSDDEGREFCRGYMDWDSPLVRRPWLDKWLCSVIKGSLGFIEIHYGLFASAVSCDVNVFLAAPSSCGCLYIRGLIACGYDIEYTTTFDKKYNCSFLLDKGDDEEEAMVLEFGANRKMVNIPKTRSMRRKHNKHWISMPLSKPVVCVPTDNTLEIEVNLSVGCDSVVSVEKLMGSMEFKIGQKTWYMISGIGVQMFVSVDWSDGFRSSKDLTDKS